MARARLNDPYWARHAATQLGLIRSGRSSTLAPFGISTIERSDRMRWVPVALPNERPSLL